MASEKPTTVLVTTLKEQLLQTVGKSSANINYLLGELEPIINETSLSWATSPERVTLYLEDMETHAQRILDTITTIRTIHDVEQPGSK